MSTKSANYQLSVFVQSISSRKLQKTTFYTIVLRTGSKEVQLPHKKSLTESNLISFLENLNLKLSNQQLQLNNYQASMQIYSVQKYGKKTLEGQFNFQIQITNRKEIRTNFNFNLDFEAQIKLSYGLFKIQSRLLSQKSSLSRVSRSSTPKQIKKELQIDFLSALIKTQKQRTNSEPARSIQINKTKPQLTISISQEINKKKSSDRTRYTTIEQQLKLIESCQNALEKCKKSNIQKQFNQQKTIQEGSKSEFFNKICLLKGTLNKVHQKQQMLQNQQQIEDLVSSELKRSLEPFNYKIQNLHKNYNQNYQEQKLQIRQTIQYNLQKQSPRTSQKKIKTQFSGFLSPQNFDQNITFANAHSFSITEAGVKQKNLALIKPQKKIDSYQQWQNDDNLRNVLPQNIDEVKSLNGFIKLSKLFFLRKKYEQARKSNKFLSDAMNVLIENEMILKKKLQVSDKIIKQKEEILNNEMRLLKNQFKQASNKLLEKYKEEAFKEQKIKQMQAKNEKNQKQIKELTHKLELKSKHIQNLRQALIHYEQQQIPTPQLKKVQQKNQTSLKQPKFRRNSQNNLIKKQTELSFRKNITSREKDKSQLQLSSPYTKQNLDQFKGINPLFIDFFTSFRTKNSDFNQANQNQDSKGPPKKTRIYRKNKTNLDIEPSIGNSSQILFDQI